MTLRPFGMIQSGELRVGLEVEREAGVVRAIRPHRGLPEPYVLSVPFVNAHSHLEYRGMQGRLDGLDYWPWIRELTRLKALQSPEEVKEDCRLAAQENKRTGVGLIGEHSDRVGSGEALAAVGIGGIIFQEVITFFERESPFDKLRAVAGRARQNAGGFQGPVIPNPHSLYTVDRSTLRSFGRGYGRVSLHLAESVHERAFTERGEGPIADFYRSQGVDVEPTGVSPLETAISLKLVRKSAQLVHCCDFSPEDVRRLAPIKASVAHCPRSNLNLNCPPAPIREMLRAGIFVGLGMDSAASSGPIDMFEEMRSAYCVASSRAKPLTGEEVWNMATTMGAKTLGRQDWDLKEGFTGPLIAVETSGALSAEDLIQKSTPEMVRWID